jgi:glycosyltransferase involved in cell wall biosynthesis
MKKILCFIDNLGPGGAQRQIVGLASFLKEKGYDVTVAFYDDNRFYVNLLQSLGVPYVYFEKAQKTTFRLWHVARYFRKMKPDVVIAYLETPSICACVARLFNHRFKLIVSERNTTQHTGTNERIRFNLFRIADYVVPNAYSQEIYMRTTFPKLADKIVTIPNFVDLEHFVPPLERRRREVPEIMIAASIWPSKNTVGFIDAVAKLKEKGHKFHISWYGLNKKHIDYINQCKQKIERFGVADCIELKEKTAQIKERYQDADYFCLPSFYEGTPNVICEAMACGLPVVCSDVCDNSKYVIEDKNGFLFNPKDTDSIVDAFGTLFALTEEEYKSYCQNSRALAEQKLSKEAFVNAYLKLINE